MAYSTKEKRAAYARKYRARPEVKKSDNSRMRARNAKRRGILSDLKVEFGCADCGYNENPAALQFDHVRGEKLHEVSKMLSFKAADVEAELRKCEVVCANCHMIRSQERNHVGRYVDAVS